MWMAAALLTMVALHLALTHAAAERFNVFVSLSLMSLLSSLVLAAIVAGALCLLGEPRAVAVRGGALGFAALLLVFSAQMGWECLRRPR